MSNVQAALGLGQLERLDQLLQAKRRIFGWYESDLGDLDSVRLNREQADAVSSYWMTSIELQSGVGLTRDDFCSKLKERNIDTRPVFPAISQYEFWPRAQETQPNAKWISNRGVNLPSGVCLRRHHVAYITQAIREILE
jgi:perosamine synthetase